MPLWPFRRKSRRRRGRAATTDYEEYGARAAGAGLPRSQTVPEVAMGLENPAPERQASKRQRTGSNKLHRRPRAYSFSPGRDDSLLLGRANNDRGPAPTGVDAVRDEMLWRVPTLNNQRDGGSVPRKLSSKKRRRDDRQREAEIKALSSFAPRRPATEEWSAGRPLRKESRKARTGFGIGTRVSDSDNHTRSSDISLPLPESIDSALSSDSEYISFRVSALEALAPRPTLRYSTHQRSGAGAQDGADLTRRPSQQQRRKLVEPIPEETLKAHKRVDSLADDLSASELRELMERDQRRRARKKQLEQERVARRIARRAEKQKAIEAESSKHGRESPPNLERGVLGREDVGLGIDPASAIVTSSKVRHLDDPLEHAAEAREASDLEANRYGSQPDPRAVFHPVDSQTLRPPETPSETKQPPTNPARLPSKASIQRKLSRSKSPQESETQTEHSVSSPFGPEGGSGKVSRSWASFFRWNRNRRHSGGPSSFSNTSRDSMQTTSAPTPPVNIVPRRMNSGVPKRTMSRFREDLPELPISPPASRMQSPETETTPSLIATSSDAHAVAEEPLPSPSTYRPGRGTPSLNQRSTEAMRRTPSTFSQPEEPGVSPEPQAMSLASIDSEGSWFSTKLSRQRKSSGIMEQASRARLPRQIPASDAERPPEHSNGNDDMDITEDDYLSRLTPANGERYTWNRQSTGEARPSSDWGDVEAHWGSVRGQQPTVMRSSQVAGRVKSHEGLLKLFGEEGDSGNEQGDTGDSSDVSEDLALQRATSIDYGKAHARRISAGSARLLSITPRSSIDKHGAAPSSAKAAE